MQRIKHELKITGINPLLIGGAMTVAFGLLSVLCGELLTLAPFALEVIYPFYAAIAIGEWGKLRADENYDVIAAQCNSLFAWAFFRFAASLLIVSLSACGSMLLIRAVRGEMPLWEMAAMYISPAFFLGSLSALLNLCCAQEHVSALVCGIVWLCTMISQSLLRLPGAEYIYLFIRYAGAQRNIWLMNKAVLLCAGLLLWLLIRRLCAFRKR